MEQAIKDLGLEHQDFDFENDEIYTEESEVCKQCFKTLSKEDLQLINITLKKYENNR